MPAVDPARLARQIDFVVEVFGDPSRLRARTVDLLEFYGSRVKAASGGGRTGSVRAFGVPPAVLRALQGALEKRALAEPHPAAMAAEALWSPPVLEARWLAVALLELQPVASLPEWVVGWSETAEDPELVERLAAGPMRRVWRGAASLFWTAAEANLQASGPAATVTLLALRDIVPELAPDELPRVFELLDRSPVPPAGEGWRAYLGVVGACGRRSPPETARFLVDSIEHARPGATRVARRLLPDFPPRHRDALRQALRLTEARAGASSSRT